MAARFLLVTILNFDNNIVENINNKCLGKSIFWRHLVVMRSIFYQFKVLTHYLAIGIIRLTVELLPHRVAIKNKITFIVWPIRSKK